MEALTRTAGPAGDRLPRRFGRYHLFDRIGRGGMADIYLALASTEIGVTRRVVVKQILESLCSDAEFSRLLVEEAKLVAGLRHGNVAQVLDLGREGQRLFIAMEYVEGYDLNQLLRRLSQRRLPLPAEFALLIVREVLAALDFAHRKKDAGGVPLGIVHCDVSPSNVLISFDGEVKLCDFGIAKAYGARGSGGAERVAGKAAYMSPEHADGARLDARADIFSAGIILHELCAGRRLYKGTEAEMLAMAQRAEISPLPDRGLRDQPALQAILDRALARDPAARFETAGQMLRALDQYAMSAKLVASQIRFGAFLTGHFESEVIDLRRERERAASAVDLRAADPGNMSSLDTSPEAATSEPVAAPRPSAPSLDEAYPLLSDDLPSDTVVVDREAFAQEVAADHAASDASSRPGSNRDSNADHAANTMALSNADPAGEPSPHPASGWAPPEPPRFTRPPEVAPKRASDRASTTAASSSGRTALMAFIIVAVLALVGSFLALGLYYAIAS